MYKLLDNKAYLSELKQLSVYENFIKEDKKDVIDLYFDETDYKSYAKRFKKAVEKGSNVYKDFKKDASPPFTTLDKAIQDRNKKAVKSSMGKGIAIGVAAAVIIYAAYQIYKRFLSKAAKACKGQSDNEKTLCMYQYKIKALEAARNELTKGLSKCKDDKCQSMVKSKITAHVSKIKKYKLKLREDQPMNFVDGYLEYLNEDRGLNLPIERDEKPNYIRMCMMQEDDRVKIRCLRKIKELTAMNPFYQYRIDRFVDAITNTYEATTEPGFNEYNLEESLNILNETLSTSVKKKLLKRNKVEKISSNEIAKAEKILRVKFHPDYRWIVENFGFIDEPNIVISGLGALDQFENIIFLNIKIIKSKLPPDHIAISYENKYKMILVLNNNNGKIVDLKNTKVLFDSLNDLLLRTL